MWVAIGMSIAGIVLSFLVGQRMLGQEAGGVALAILASELAAFVCLPATLYSQRKPGLQFLSRGTVRSWAMLALLYFGVLLGVCPWLRDWVRLAWMFVPLVLCTGLMIIFYGPLHDRIIRRSQERTKLIR